MKIQSRSDAYPVALTQIFPLSLCCWFCSAQCWKRQCWFLWDDGLAWAGVCFGPLVTQTIILSINLPQTNTLNTLKYYGQDFQGGETNMLPSYFIPGLFCVIVSVMELRGARQTEELSQGELMHSRCSVKRLQRAAHFTAKVRTGTLQRLKISLWFMLLFVSSCGSSQQNQHALTLDFTSQSRTL